MVFQSIVQGNVFSIHPSIFLLLSGVGFRWQWAWQFEPDLNQTLSTTPTFSSSFWGIQRHYQAIWHAQTDSFQQNKQDSWWRVCLPGTWNLLRRIWTQLLLLSYRDWMSLHTNPLPAPTSSGAACCWCWPGLEVGKRGSFHHPKTSPVQVSSSIFNITLHCVQ